MEIIEKIHEMQKRSEGFRLSGKTIAFVPTMGFLHEGHLELMRAGKRRADILIVCIFVNPLQFGPAEDFETYPRDMERDLSKSERTGADIVFVPSNEEMYQEGFQATVSVERIAKHLCGLRRPGHFNGVATVVTKLLNITRPHVALFGQKDFQQWILIRRMARDLNMDIEIVGVPTVREADGLAMSSRNSYLGPAERRSALCLKKSLDLAGDMLARGQRNAGKIKAAIEELILSHPHTVLDYVSLCNPASLEEVDAVEDETLLALAVRVGKTRLIDNCLLGA